MASSSTLSPAGRQPWLDHLRLIVILCVVNMHACVTYSHVGSWYVNSEQKPSLPVTLVFILWQAFLQSFFMGLLFFVAGYFAQGALTRKGPGAFARERLYRLGLPALLYMLVIHPFIVRGLNPWNAEMPSVTAYYAHFLRSGRWLSASGPLWFALALLIFSLVLAGWRATPEGRRRSVPSASGATRPTLRGLIACALGVGAATFAVRFIQPLGTDVYNMQLGYFAQYVAAFIAGLAAARQGWLRALASSSVARRAGWAALFGGPLVLLAALLLGMKGGNAAFAGGPHWQAAALAFWEQLTGLGASLGLLAFCLHRLNREHRSLRWLSDRAFAVYVLHPPVIIALTMLYRRLPQNALGLAALLTVTGLGATFVLAEVAKRIPVLRDIL